jgi:hypothetical protein
MPIPGLFVGVYDVAYFFCRKVGDIEKYVMAVPMLVRYKVF